MSSPDTRAPDSPRLGRTTLAVLAIGLIAPISHISNTLVATTPKAVTEAKCPWATSFALTQSPVSLASEVLSRMTLREKLGFVNLAAVGGYENANTAVPRLCLPALTLQDSPNGIAYGAKHVTQLPASLGIAASFNTALAYDYGQVEGQEAKGKGIDVVQGPELNLDRVPNSGRAFEAYGEDPLLTSALGVANIEGIQSEGVMADAKHYSAYNQETGRLLVDQVISPRALAEIYQPPFQAAVQVAHVASIMCAYGELNGVNSCSSPYLYRSLTEWGFTGFVRSDLTAVSLPVPAFRAGMSMIKPSVVPQLASAIAHRALSETRLNDAVLRILSEMFRFHMIEQPPRGRIGAYVATPAHATFALYAAERSIVLLKNAGTILPMQPSRLKSVAVIGDDAGRVTASAGFGSAHVSAPFVVTPLAGLKAALGTHVAVTYSPGGGSALQLPDISPSVLVSSTKLSSGAEPPEFTSADPQGVADLEVAQSPAVTRAALTASAPQHGKNWATWSATLTPADSGYYTVSLTQVGDAWLYLNGKVVISSAGLHRPAPWSTTVSLVAGVHYRLQLNWFVTRSDAEPRLGWAYQSPSIAKAVLAAKAAQVAVVFASDFNEEGVDRPTLSLPGDEDALISAVSAVNPRTVVVLNTGGPVLMPWLAKVAAVVEAWYPGEEGGAAVAAVLTGRVDPAGHLPVTFPANAADVPAHAPSSWPGSAGTITYGEGLRIGYRYDEALGLSPLFAFGFGLSYTTFSIGGVSVHSPVGSVSAKVTVRNRGSRSGTAVVQAYLGYPPGSGEPPRQLRAFATEALAAGHSATVTLHLSRQDFEAFLNGRFTTLAGNYTLYIGQSSQDLPLSVSLQAP